MERDGREQDTTRSTIRRLWPRGARPEWPTLRVVHCPDPDVTGAELALDGTGAYLFGRSREALNPVVDGRMSRLHFRLDPGERGYLIEDLGSTNGTYLDGRRVKGRLPLEGQVIAAGDTLLVVDPVADHDDLPAAADVSGEDITEIVGVSNFTRALRSSVATVGPTRDGVLLLGPTGTGKEVTARAIHAVSGRKGPFVPVNCAAIPHEIAEAELFGHEKGAFTGADRARVGAFRASSGGTLFLDEVGDLPPPVQPKLLRTLETSVVQPLGGGPPVPVDLRVVAATHLDLETSGFRQDLLARLCDWVLRLPSLATRKADVIPLFRYFSELAGHPPGPGDAELYEALLLHDWPMNVRELSKLARRLITLTGPGGALELALLPSDLQEPIVRRYREGGREGGAPRPGSDIRTEADIDREDEASTPTREALEAALARAKGNVKLAAQQNGWHRTSLYRWLHRNGVDPSRFR